MAIEFKALPTDKVRALQAGGTDAYGFAPERRLSDGNGVPCRHCLKKVAKGEPYLILAYRPFPDLQPYAETGPIFLHAEPCERASDSQEWPPMMTGERYLLRGYGADNRIVYGTGDVVASSEIPTRAEALFDRGDIAYIHLRSAAYNCYQCRVDRAR